MNLRKNIITKKAFRYLNDIVRPLQILSSTQSDFERNPVVLVNSFPKSGTHLLHQVLSTLPGIKDRGNFIASQPSFTFKEVSDDRIEKRLKLLLPGELVPSHMHYSENIENIISNRNIFKVFIYRDLRDVTISEAYYLSKMNNWHKLSSRFRKLDTIEERINLSLNGLKDSNVEYPNVVLRFKKYFKWLESENCFVLKFEDLVSADSRKHLYSLAEDYCMHKNEDVNTEELATSFLEAIKPDKSHTFREGKKNQWVTVYKDSMKQRFKEILMQEFSDQQIEKFRLL